MKKLFISQPMKGKSDEDILKERNKAIAEAERLCDDVVEVLDSFFQARQQILSRYGSWASLWRYCPRLMWRISHRDGKMREGAGSSTNAQWSTASIVSNRGMACAVMRTLHVIEHITIRTNNAGSAGR